MIVAKLFIDQVHISIKGDKVRMCHLSLVKRYIFDRKIMLKQSRSIMTLQSERERLFRVHRCINTIWKWFRIHFKAALRTIVPILKPVANASLKSMNKVDKDQGVHSLKENVDDDNVKQVLRQRKPALKNFG